MVKMIQVTSKTNKKLAKRVDRYLNSPHMAIPIDTAINKAIKEALFGHIVDPS